MRTSHCHENNVCEGKGDIICFMAHPELGVIGIFSQDHSLDTKTNTIEVRENSSCAHRSTKICEFETIAVVFENYETGKGDRLRRIVLEKNK